MTQEELQDKIIERAGADGEYRSRLLSDPRAAIDELTKAPLPREIDVQVHEESATSFHLVLPPGSRLTEPELAQVFGGVDWACSTGACGNPSCQ
jgi:hypothetical protein